MPIPTDLLNAVIAAPNTDTPRADVAKWFRNSGQQERAHFIDDQLYLPYIPKGNVDANVLNYKLENSLKKHGQTWCQFDEILPLVDDFRFYRGFVELVKLSAESFLSHGDTLFTKAPIRHLDLTDVKPVAKDLFNSKLLSNIQSLSIGYNELTDEHMELMAASPHLQNLKWLSLMMNDISLNGAEELAKSEYLDNLNVVIFYGNQVDPTEVLIDDQNVILEQYLPPEGQEIEARQGHINWLHKNVTLYSDYPPSRFL